MQAAGNDRVLLRPLRSGDAARLEAVLADPAVCRFTPCRSGSGLMAAHDFISLCHAHAAIGALHSLAVVRVDDPDRFLGIVQASRPTADVELGFALAKAEWNQGLMTEAIRLLIRWIACQAHGPSAWAACDVDNAAAGRLLLRAGFAADGILPAYRVHPALGNAPRDCLRYIHRFD